MSSCSAAATRGSTPARWDSLVDASDFVRTIETRQGMQIAALEEIAYTEGWIDRDTLLQSAERYGKSPYGQHLKKVAEGKIRY